LASTPKQTVYSPTWVALSSPNFGFELTYNLASSPLQIVSPVGFNTSTPCFGLQYSAPAKTLSAKMTLTKAKTTEAFKHLLNVVFRVPKDGPLYKALMKSGDTDIRDILSLSETDIDSLTYDRSDTEKDTPLSRGDKALIHIFMHYIIHCSSIGSPIGTDWLLITPEDLGKYQIGPDYVATEFLRVTALSQPQQPLHRVHRNPNWYSPQ